MSFPKLLRRLVKQEPGFRARLLRTCHETGYFTEGMVLTKMSYQERQEVSRMHWDALATDKDYAAAQLFDLKALLPKRAGPAVTKDKEVSSEGRPMVLLEGGGAGVVVWQRYYRQLKERHPQAEWRFALGDYWEKPLVLLVPRGLYEGSLLGAISPIRYKMEGYLESLPPGKDFWRRRGYTRYQRVSHVQS